MKYHLVGFVVLINVSPIHNTPENVFRIGGGRSVLYYLLFFICEINKEATKNNQEIIKLILSLTFCSEGNTNNTILMQGSEK